ncbi:unnamed protein product [Calicophoron daubneyi]|uniref:Uncharacterized protein n=1 Tax=Calicophoron daubneyi TaxID=300641 RepID=A0AAV2T2V8_CALDB
MEIDKCLIMAHNYSEVAYHAHWQPQTKRSTQHGNACHRNRLKDEICGVPVRSTGSHCTVQILNAGLEQGPVRLDDMPRSFDGISPGQPSVAPKGSSDISLQAGNAPVKPPCWLGGIKNSITAEAESAQCTSGRIGSQKASLLLPEAAEKASARIRKLKNLAVVESKDKQQNASGTIVRGILRIPDLSGLS